MDTTHLETRKAIDPKWWGFLASFPIWLRLSAMILMFIAGTAVGLIVASIIFARAGGP
jgi:hypothetical protein